jgi:hypothetical protein
VFHSAFEPEYQELYTSNRDITLSSKDHDKAIELSAAAIDLDSASIVSRCTAKLGEMLWEDALLDAQKVR